MLILDSHSTTRRTRKLTTTPDVCSSRRQLGHAAQRLFRRIPHHLIPDARDPLSCLLAALISDNLRLGGALEFTHSASPKDPKITAAIQPRLVVSRIPSGHQGSLRQSTDSWLRAFFFINFACSPRRNHAQPAPLCPASAFLIPRLKHHTTPEPIPSSALPSWAREHEGRELKLPSSLRGPCHRRGSPRKATDDPNRPPRVPK